MEAQKSFLKSNVSCDLYEFIERQINKFDAEVQEALWVLFETWKRVDLKNTPSSRFYIPFCQTKVISLTLKFSSVMHDELKQICFNYYDKNQTEQYTVNIGYVFKAISSSLSVKKELELEQARLKLEKGSEVPKTKEAFVSSFKSLWGEFETGMTGLLENLEQQHDQW